MAVVLPPSEEMATAVIQPPSGDTQTSVTHSLLVGLIAHAAMASSSAEQPSKKRRLELASIIARSSLPIRPQAVGLGVSVHDGRREIHKHDKAETPYGPLYVDLLINEQLTV